MQTTTEEIRALVKPLQVTAGRNAPGMVLYALAAFVRTSNAPMLATCSDRDGGGQRWDVIALDGGLIVRLEAEHNSSDWAPRLIDQAQDSFVRATVRTTDDVVSVAMTEMAHVDSDFQPVTWAAGWRITFNDGDTIELPLPTNHHRGGAQEAIIDVLLDGLRSRGRQDPLP